VSGLISPNHPVQSAWYANPNPTFSWRGEVATPAIAGYSYLLDQNPTTVPDTTVDLAPLSFAPPRDSAIGTSTSDTVVGAPGDFNRDGKLDLAVLNGHANSVLILLGKGNGTFRAPRAIRVGPRMISVAVGDLNRDGKLDLVISSHASGKPTTISVLLGNGNGTFQAPRSYSLGNAASAYNTAPVVLADLNGDGRLDVVTSWGPRIFVLLGRGDGTLGPAHSFSAGVAGNNAVLSLALRDLNGDGRLDAVAGVLQGVNSPGGFLSVLMGKGNGTFKAATTTSTGELQPWSVALTDLNRDGKPDLLVANYEDGADYGNTPYCAVDVSLGNGDGTFSQPVQ
jgi:hypothetical protein